MATEQGVASAAPFVCLKVERRAHLEANIGKEMADQCDAMLAATQREMDYCKAEFAKHAHTKDEAREWYQTCTADPLRQQQAEQLRSGDVSKLCGILAALYEQVTAYPGLTFM
jgi:hypothetical protein